MPITLKNTKTGEVVRFRRLKEAADYICVSYATVRALSIGRTKLCRGQWKVHKVIAKPWLRGKRKSKQAAS